MSEPDGWMLLVKADAEYAAKHPYRVAVYVFGLLLMIPVAFAIVLAWEFWP